MSVLATFPKQPAEVLDFDLDYSDWLTDRSDTIATATAVAETGLTVDSVTNLNGVVKVWVSGGADGTRYKVTATVVTAGGRTKEAEIAIRVKAI